VGRTSKESNGTRMLREEDIDLDGDIGLFHCRKSFRYSKRETMAGKEDHHREFEEIYPYEVLYITLYR
jgi:hypothetical protein